MEFKKDKIVRDFCIFNKGTVMIKLSKKSPVLPRMAVLTAVMICSLYICSACLGQTKVQNKTNVARIKLLEQTCVIPKVSQSEIPYLHYPEPTTFSRKECACTPVRFFVIVSTQRSGSGWFETLLNSHMNVSSNGEIFYVVERFSSMAAITAVLDKVYNLDWNTSASKNECTAAVGFKWMLNQGLMDRYGEIAEYFNRRGVSVIFLFRRNKLRQLISILANSHDQYARQLNGTHKAHVHSTHEAEILARYKPMIDSNSLVAKLKELHDSVGEAIERLKSTRHIVLYYEDLVQNPNKLEDVMDFLGVPQRRLKSRHVKIHTNPISHLVQNWDAVHSSLKGTPFETFLTPDYQL